MHIPVELLKEYSIGICSSCAKEDDLVTLSLFVGTGNVTIGGYCTACFKVQDRIRLEVVQEELSGGRHPPNKRDKRLTRKQELRIADDIGGRRQPGSGNQDHAKGDVRKKGAFRGEAKYTRAKQFTLKREELDKINGECTGQEKPFLQVDFLNSSTNKVEDSWVVIPYEDWKANNNVSG